MVEYFTELKNLFKKNNLKTILYAIVLMSFFWLIIPLFVFFGYLVFTIRNIYKEKNIPPLSLKFFLPYLTEGVGIFGIILAYLAPSIILIELGTFGKTYTPADLTHFSPLSIGVIFLASILFLIAIFLLPFSLIRYSMTGSFKEAFNFFDILYRIKRRLIEYFFTYLLSLALWLIPFLLAFVPGLNFLFGGFVSIIILYSYICFTRVYQEIDFEQENY